MDYSQRALDLHEKHHGKIELALKVPLNTKEDLAVAYTPGVAAVCRAIVEDPASAKELTLKGNTIAVVTDGSAVLGLGNIGSLAGLPVMEGKCALFKRFAGLDAFPICLDTQEIDEIVATVERIAPVFAGVNLEDIAAPKCFEIERRLKEALNIPVMHDYQHGTAVVVLAALINSLKVKNIDKQDVKVVVNGAGAAGLAIADLLLQFGIKNILVLDSQGVLHSGRTDLNPEKLQIAQRSNAKNLAGGLDTAVQGADVFVGVSKAGVLTQDLVRLMAPEPVVFALANPTPEIMPDEALAAGALVVATGRSDFPNQINNVLAFPGIFRGAVDNGVVQITDAMLLKAAQNLAGLVDSPTPNLILPDAFDSRIVPAVASAIY